MSDLAKSNGFAEDCERIVADIETGVRAPGTGLPEIACALSNLAVAEEVRRLRLLVERGVHVRAS